MKNFAPHAKRRLAPVTTLAALTGLISLFCGFTACPTRQAQARQAQAQARQLLLSEARRGFRTTLLPPQNTPKDVLVKAPPAAFRTITYPAPSGDLAAYLTPDLGDNKQHPAIIWIAGGDCNSLGDVWNPGTRQNDQTAMAYRKTGIVMMFPSLRGGNTNPGRKEGFLGEVDDVLAAANYLEKQKYVDPKRIYLGGHSTGGTLVLLVSECSSRFRAVFSFGPVADVSSYGTGSGFLPFDTTNRREVIIRSPGYWLSSVASPVWVLEGSAGQSNIGSVQAMAKISTNPYIHFVEVRKASHFSALAPTNELIARKIVRDTGTTTNMSLSSDEVSQNFAQ